jgi:small conductance mechanosensitive channel
MPWNVRPQASINRKPYGFNLFFLRPIKKLTGLLMVGPRLEIIAAHFHKRQEEKMHTAFKELLEQTILYSPRLASGLIIFFLFWLAAHFSHKIILKMTHNSTVNPAILDLATTVVRITLLAFGAVTALGTLGINISALVASLGLTGFALGFALRDALSNLLAGVLILIYCTYKLNDRIAVSGFEGLVTKINLRYTTLLTEDATVLIPNATMFSNPVKILTPGNGCQEENELVAKAS